MDRRPNEKAATKPTYKLVRMDENVIEFIGHVRQVLRDAGQIERASEFVFRATRDTDYDRVMRICREYVEIEG